MDKFTKYALWAIALLFVVGMTIQIASAEQPKYHTVEKNFDFVSSAAKDEQVLQPFSLNIPGGYSSIESFTLEFTGDYAGATMYGILNTSQGIVYCNPNGWVTPNSEGYTTKFDCTVTADNHTKKEKETGAVFRELVSFSGVGFETDKAIANVYGTIKITYLDKGAPTITVGGTEYTPGDNAKVWVHLLDANGEYVEDGACQVDIYTPTNDELLEKAAMTNIQHDGIYVYDLTAPQAHGVYPVIARCYYNVSQTTNNATSFTLTTGTVNGGTYLLTKLIDGQEHKIEQLAGVLDFYYDYDSMCGLTTDELLLTGMTITTNSKWVDSPVNDDIILSIYNFTSSSWIDLDNKIISPNDRVTVSNFIETNNFTRDGLVNGAGTARVRMRDTLTSGTNKKIEVDQLIISCEEFSNPTWTEVRGSAEMHISSDKYWVAQVESGQIFNDTWPGEFWYNVTLSSQTSQFEEEQRIKIELPTPFPCHHIQTLYVDEVNTSFECHNAENPDTRGASVEWLQDLNTSQNYDVRIVAENYFKEVEQNWVTQSKIEYDIINIACENYQEANSLPNYTIPSTTPLDYNNNTLDNYWLVCQQYLDQYYHFNYTYFNEFKTDIGTFTDDEMHYLDNQWIHLIQVKNGLDQLAQAIMNGMQTGALYSIAVVNDPYPPTNPNYTIYWAQVSDNYLNYLLLASVNATTNPTSIANAVWQYSGTPATGLLDLISGNVWSYVTRTLTAAPVNVTQIADAVWNENQTKYTHGVTY